MLVQVIHPCHHINLYVRLWVLEMPHNRPSQVHRYPSYNLVYEIYIISSCRLLYILLIRFWYTEVFCISLHFCFSLSRRTQLWPKLLLITCKSEKYIELIISSKSHFFYTANSYGHPFLSFASLFFFYWHLGDRARLGRYGCLSPYNARFCKHSFSISVSYHDNIQFGWSTGVFPPSFSGLHRPAKFSRWLDNAVFGRSSVVLEVG